MSTSSLDARPIPPPDGGALSPEQYSQLKDDLELALAQRVQQLGEAESVLARRGADPVAAAYFAAVERMLGEIENALARMSDGSYGICRHCQHPIQFERLELVPYTDGCMGCLRS